MNIATKLKSAYSSLATKVHDATKSLAHKLTTFGSHRLHKPIPEHVKEKAAFADVSYSQSPPSQLQGFGDLLTATDDVKVYKDDMNKRLNVSIRGTDLSNPKRAIRDLPTDLKVIFGAPLQNDPRYREADKTVKDLKQQYPGYDVSAYGFSLGGALSKRIGDDNSIKSYNFNPLSSLASDARPARNSTTYRSYGDLLSVFNKTDKDVVYMPEKMPFYPHGLDNLK